MTGGRRRRRGWGEDAIYRDGDRWRGAISVGLTADGRRNRVKVSGDTKAEVIAKLKDVHRALDAGVESPTSRLTVGAYLDRWIEGLPARVDRSTADDYGDMVRLHLKPGLGSRLLTKVSVADLNALWVAKRKAWIQAKHDPHHADGAPLTAAPGRAGGAVGAQCCCALRSTSH